MKVKVQTEYDLMAIFPPDNNKENSTIRRLPHINSELDDIVEKSG